MRWFLGDVGRGMLATEDSRPYKDEGYEGSGLLRALAMTEDEGLELF